MRDLPDLDRYRPNVGVCLMNRDGLVWLGQRIGPGGKDVTHRWQMPQGGVDPGETIEIAAARELHEETGVRSARLLMLTPGWLVYDFPEGHASRKREKWRGQRQKWALMLFEGEDDEVDLCAHDPCEFSDWRWATLEETPDLIVPFKRGVYESLREAFSPFAAQLADRRVRFD